MAVFIHLVPGTPQVGLWCPKCLLPSGFELPVYTLGEDGPRQMLCLRRCDDCGQPLEESS